MTKPPAVPVPEVPNIAKRKRDPAWLRRLKKLPEPAWLRRYKKEWAKIYAPSIPAWRMVDGEVTEVLISYAEWRKAFGAGMTLTGRLAEAAHRGEGGEKEQSVPPVARSPSQEDPAAPKGSPPTSRSKREP